MNIPDAEDKKESWEEIIHRFYARLQDTMAMQNPELLDEVSHFLSEYRGVIEDLPRSLDRLSRVMIRNRKREVLKGEIVDRKAYKVEVRPTSEEKMLYDQVSSYIKKSYARVTSQNNMRLVSF